MPLKKAPILQPKASRAPYPIKIPPIIAANRDRNDILIFELTFPARLDAMNAPMIKPIFVRETESFKILCCSAWDG